MLKPYITREFMPPFDRTNYVLVVPNSYLIESRRPRWSLFWWMIRLAWTVIIDRRNRNQRPSLGIVTLKIHLF